MRMRAHPYFSNSERTGAVMLMRTDMGSFARPERPSLLLRMSRGLWDAVASMEGWLEFRRQRRELLGLDDRMLKDIGLSRSDVMRVKPARNPRHHRM